MCCSSHETRSPACALGMITWADATSAISRLQRNNYKDPNI